MQPGSGRQGQRRCRTCPVHGRRRAGRLGDRKRSPQDAEAGGHNADDQARVPRSLRHDPLVRSFWPRGDGRARCSRQEQRPDLDHGRVAETVVTRSPQRDRCDQARREYGLPRRTVGAGPAQPLEQVAREVDRREPRSRRRACAASVRPSSAGDQQREHESEQSRRLMRPFSAKVQVGGAAWRGRGSRRSRRRRA